MTYLAYLKLIILSVYPRFCHQQRMICGRHPQLNPPGSTGLPLSVAAAGRTAGGRREESSTSNDPIGSMYGIFTYIDP